MPRAQKNLPIRSYAIAGYLSIRLAFGAGSSRHTPEVKVIPALPILHLAAGRTLRCNYYVRFVQTVYATRAPSAARWP